MQPNELGNTPLPLESKTTNGPLIEQLLSPQMLQRMMASGGAILVIGLVGWLWSIGIFENPLVGAMALGVSNLTVLGVGIGLVKGTRYKTAGTGLTLLASLALPLNLWFYSAQGLITIEGGGHLWIPAAICCAIYAAVARILRDHTFVYALVGGQILTGMLFLADESVGRFWEVLPHATLLIATAWSCIYSWWLFGEEGDFSRTTFGRAFRISGLASLFAGLGLVMSGQASTWFTQAVADLGFLDAPTTSDPDKLWGLTLIAVSAVGCLGQYVLRKSPLQWFMTVALSLWGVLTTMDFLSIEPRLPHLAILGCVAVAWGAWREKKSVTAWNWAAGGLVMLGFLEFCGQFFMPANNPVIVPSGWLSCFQLICTAATCGFVWHLARKDRKEAFEESHVLAGLGGCSLVWALLTGTLVFGFSSLGTVAAAAIVGPIAFASMVLIRGNTDDVKAGSRRAALASITMLSITLGVFAAANVVTGGAVHLTWAWILGIAAAVYFVAASKADCGAATVLGYLAATGSASQMLTASGLHVDYSLVLSASLVGAILAVVNSLRRTSVSDPDFSQGNSLELPANLLVMAGNMMGVLLALSRCMTGEATGYLLLMLAGQLVATAIAGLLTRFSGWRQAFRASAVGTVATAAIVLNSFVDLHWVQRVELVTVASGIVLLIIGHLAWYREGEKRDEGATLGLGMGSLATALPLTVGLLFYRLFEVQHEGIWMLFHEIAAVSVALVLLGMGLTCRIRSTTIAGVSMLGVYVMSLPALIQWPDQLRSVSVVMMVGGGAFFLISVLLSIYRDRIVGLPNEIREGRGVFRVLQWR